MSEFLLQMYLHVVFSTKNRVPWFKDVAFRGELYAYLTTVLKGIQCPAISINGTEDHVHVLCDQSPNISIDGLVEKMKKPSAAWIKIKESSYEDFDWQEGYGAFSVSRSDLPAMRRQIAAQEEFHRTVSYQDEFRALCKEHGLEIDEHHGWD